MSPDLVMLPLGKLPLKLYFQQIITYIVDTLAFLRRHLFEGTLCEIL